MAGAIMLLGAVIAMIALMLWSVRQEASGGPQTGLFALKAPPGSEARRPAERNVKNAANRKHGARRRKPSAGPSREVLEAEREIKENRASDLPETQDAVADKMMGQKPRPAAKPLFDKSRAARKNMPPTPPNRSPR